jgi:ABC-type transport system involved in cytochrome bd biosynthesis fused ATPase/permease subunit
LNTRLSYTLQNLEPGERITFYRLSVLGIIAVLADMLFLAALVWLAAGRLFHNLNSTSNPGGFITEGKWLLILYFIKNILAWQWVKNQYRFVYNVAARISKSRLQKYLHSSVAAFTDINSAAHQYRISQQPVEFAHYVLVSQMQWIQQVFLLILGSVALLIVDAKLFLIVAACLLPAGWLVSWWLKKKIMNERKDLPVASEKAARHLREALDGFVESRLYQQADFFTNRYAASQQQLNNRLWKLQSYQALPARLLELAVLAAFFILAWYATESANGKNWFISAGAFLAAAYKMIPSLGQLIQARNHLHTYAHTIPEQNDQTPASAGKSTEKINLLELKELVLSRNEKELFKPVNLQLKPGDFAGISAPSGTGKTTLLEAILGLNQPVKGTIAFNGHIHTPEEIQAWHTHTALVKQQVFLMDATVEENISWSADKKDTKKMEEILQAVGLTDQRFEKPLSTGEAGRRISGGQQQRIALARALYKDADLILLDEPFNELDGSSENQLLELLFSMAQKGKIILLVTHRAESFRFCNQVIELHAAG